MKRIRQWLALMLMLCLLAACGNEAASPADGTAPPVTEGVTTTASVPSSTETTTATVPSSSVSASAKTTTTTAVKPIETNEMRAVWFAFSDLNELLGGKTASQAKAALDTAMKKVRDFGCNTVIFHVRANSDAYYDSALFPHADAVKALIKAGLDPLAEGCRAAHRYGLSIQAWINPYRIGKTEANARCEDRFLCDSRWYYIPTSQAAQKLILDGVREVMRYDVDGLQFDDYFYPKEAFGEETPAAFEEGSYQPDLGTVGDWRRAAVSSLVRATYQLVHQKSGRVFGISPSHSMATNHDLVYADVAKWIAESGYVDYICPQIYFGFDHSTAAFGGDVDLWCGYPRHSSVKLYVGLALYKTGIDADPYAGDGKNEWATHADVMKREVQYLRQKDAVSGWMLFRFAHLTATAKRDSSFDRAIAEKELSALRSVL